MNEKVNCINSESKKFPDVKLGRKKIINKIIIKKY